MVASSKTISHKKEINVNKNTLIEVLKNLEQTKKALLKEIKNK